MERKLATIRLIKEIKPIPNADIIECAIVDGWQVVVQKGQFKAGNLCVYCEIDSILPERPEFEFMRQRGFRVKTIKLCKQISQGIAFPLSILDGIIGFIPDIGLDITDMLGIEKYEPNLGLHLSGLVKGNFPFDIPKTDEERVQNIPYIFDEYKDEVFYVTEKLDGTSMTCYLKNGEFGVCSRKLDLKETKENLYWKTARDENIEEKLKQYTSNHGIKNIAIQGELIGRGIQKNRYNLHSVQFRLFDVYNIDENRYYSLDSLLEFASYYKFYTVPVLYPYFILKHSMESLLELADGTSVVCENGVLREGIVIRTNEPTYHPTLGRVSFKVISNKYLLKNE